MRRTPTALRSSTCDAVAPVRTVDETTHCLELWHGPTSAFKDMALQMLPQLLSAALRKTGESKTVCILVATSGDTGKAAMEGFADVPQTKILVFYPKDGVSKVQETQMVTQDGANVGVCAVEGNFDDAQAGVKRIFSDEAIRADPGGPGLLPLLRQLHQLGPHPAPGGLLHLRLLRPGPGREAQHGRQGELLRAHRQLRRHPGGLLRKAHGTAGREADLRLQLQRCADGLPPHRRVRHATVRSIPP